MVSHNSRGFESASKWLIWVQNAGLLGSVVAYFVAFIPLCAFSNKQANYFIAQAIDLMARLSQAAEAAAAGLRTDDILGAPLSVLLDQAARSQEQKNRETRLPRLRALRSLNNDSRGYRHCRIGVPRLCNSPSQA